MQNNFKYRHTTVLGTTQYGKTTFVKNEMLKVKNGVIFFNPQKIELKGYIKVDSRTDLNLIAVALRKGDKLNYIPKLDDEFASQELLVIVDKLFSCGFNVDKSINIVVDEVHIFSNYREGRKALKKICNRGLSFGINGVFITQSLADIDLTVAKMSTQIIFFKCSYEKEYFNRKGVPYEDIMHRIEKKGIKKNGKSGLYAYCIWDGLEVKGAYI